MKKTMTEIMKTERQMLTLAGVAAKAFAQDTLAGRKAYQMAICEEPFSTAPSDPFNTCSPECEEKQMAEMRVKMLLNAENCPRCGSPQPQLHPAVQFKGEVQICTHPWHQQPAWKVQPRVAPVATSEPMPARERIVADDVLQKIAASAKLHESGDYYLVPPSKGGKPYKVTPWSCTCLDREHRGVICKHQQAVSLLCPPAEETVRANDAILTPLDEEYFFQ